MKKYTQITFDFDQPYQEEAPAVGVRIKSLKTETPAHLSGEVNKEETGVNSEDKKEEEIIEVNFNQPEASGESTGEQQQPEEVPIQQPQAENVLQQSNRGRKPLRSYKEQAEKVNLPPREELYSRQYYTIGEVSAMFAVNPSLLRYWENEFKNILTPRKNKKGDRYYRPQDIETIHFIHDLLRRRKLTIDGAREYMKQNKKSREKFDSIQKLEEIRNFFREIQALLK
jgi:DNA-binding transcriptional MerR regulator